jgi:hypothetical protein
MQVTLYGPRIYKQTYQLKYFASAIERPIEFLHAGVLLETYKVVDFSPCEQSATAIYAGLRRSCPLRVTFDPARLR